MKFLRMDKHRRLRLLQALVIVSVVSSIQIALPADAFAAGSFDSITNALTSVSDFVTGSFARLISILVIAFLALLAFGGQLRLVVLMNIILGMAFLFGATKIVGSLSSTIGGG